MSSFNIQYEWLKELANAEVTLEKTGQMDAFGHLDEEKILTAHTLDFLHQLRSQFQQSASAFNEFRSDSRQTIKVYGIAKTEADFLVFRNSLKLVVSIHNPGQIEIAFHTLSGGLYAPMKKRAAVRKGRIPQPPGEIEQQSGDILEIELGPFNEAYWAFHGIRINASGLVRFYLTEFIKNSTA